MTSELWGQIAIAATAIVSSILGYGLAGLNDARRDRRTADREKLTRLEERQSAATAAQHEFQLATLLELQDAVQLMARLTGRSIHFDHMQARKGFFTLLPEGYSDESHANGVDVIRLRNRILDDDLRNRICQFESDCVEASLLPTRYQGLDEHRIEATALALLDTFDKRVSSIMDSLGKALRHEVAYLPDHQS